jgi:uroporphyrinogen-III decarboxylase
MKAGADYIYYPDSVSSPAFMSPAHYLEFAFPYHSKICKAAKEFGLYTVIHPCGGEYPILFDVYRIPGVDAYHFSELVDIGVIRQIYGPRALLYGNVNPLTKLLTETPQDIEEEVKKIIKAAGRLGRLLMAPGCTIPPNVPYENFKALVEACQKFGCYPMD